MPFSATAFANALPLHVLRNASAARPALCMKAKPPKSSKSKSSKSRRAETPTSAGTGFGSKTASPREPSARAVPASAPPTSQQSTEPDALSSSGAEAGPKAEGSDTASSKKSELVENTSGATGDATPKRILRPEPTEALQDPSKQAEEEEAAPLPQLPTLTASERADLLLPRDTPADALIELFADARETPRFAALVAANRHLLTQAVLLRFTSAILQVEARPADETRDTEVSNMRALRTELVSHTWAFDAAYKEAVLSAETRLVPVLQGGRIGRDIVRAAGVERLDVDGMWTVVYAAVAAWEERGKENAALQNVDMQTALAEAAAALRENKEIVSILSPSLRAAAAVLAESDPAAQARAIESLSEEDVDHLASTAEAVRLLPVAAYGGLSRRLDDIAKYAIQVKFGIDAAPVETFRFEPSDIARESRLVEFAQRSDRVRRRD